MNDCTERSTQARAAAFAAFVSHAELRLRVAFAAAVGQQRGAEATAEALACGWEHWDRLEAMDNACGYLY